MATAYQVTTASTKIFTPQAESSGEITIYNNGPEAIYIDFGEAATVAGSLPIGPGMAYTTDGMQEIYAICGTLQVSPADTRISIERRVGR